MTTTHQKGFTLIELLVVVSIVSLVSSVAMYSTASARAKADDANKKSQVHQIETAISIKKTNTGRVPRNYNCGGSYCSGGTGDSLAREGTPAFNASMQELIDEGYISAIPNSKDDSYVYYADPTASNAAFGAELVTPTALTQSSTARNYCSTIPAPYTSCVNSMNSGSYTPAQEGPGQVVFWEIGGYATQFCKIYGPATSSCWASGGNGLFADACFGISNSLASIPGGTVQMSLVPTAHAQFWNGGGGGLPGFSLCVKAAVPYDITCQLPTNTIDTCSGGDTDYCACI